MSDLSRTPPADVRRALRREVGFGCPVEGCGNPYLEYHHFDPPWNEEKHHDPARMIALCATHHAKAGAWTVQQARDLKTRALSGEVAAALQGRFEWMREDILAVVGGNYYYETPNIVLFRGQPVIWFERDAERRLLLNLEMLTTGRQPRTSLRDNDWIVRGEPEDVFSPPNGSTLQVIYANGDAVLIQFREWRERERLELTHGRVRVIADAFTFPLVTAEITLAVGGTDIRLGPSATNVGGVTMTGNVAIRCGAGLHFG